MGTVSVLGLAGAKSTPDAASAPEHESAEQPTNRDKKTFADLGARIGEDNKALRDLLIDTSHQLSTIDNLKDTFAKLVEPLSNLLTTLEQERADNAGSQGALTAIRSSHEMLRAEFQALEKKSSESAADNERLGRNLESARQDARALEEEKAKLNGEVAAARGAMAMLVKQLGEEVANARMVSEEKKLLAERSDISEQQIVGLEAEIAHARERLSPLENDKDTLQAALDRTLAESSRLYRQLAGSENALSDARSRLRQMEGSLSAVESERNSLAGACADANERRQSEVHTLGLQFNALRSRSDAAEKLAADVRQSLVERTEAMQIAEAKLLEVVLARGEAEEKVEHLAVVSSGWEQQTKRLELEVAALAERCKMLSQTLTANESSLTHAHEKIKSLAGHVERLQLDAAAYRAETEEHIVQLNATIEHERCERTLAEGALETTRADYARIQRQMSQERSTRRVDHQRRLIRNNLMP
jgi:chromosome segregation ATPase